MGGVFYSTSIATLTSESGSKLAKMFELKDMNEEHSTVLRDSKESFLFYSTLH